MKQSITTKFKRASIVSIAVVQLVFMPSSTAVFAQSTSGPGTSTAEVSTPVAEPCPATNGVQAPTGSASHTFSFNPTTCLWENPYYTWSPITKATSPRYNTGYVYNPASGKNEKTAWVYSPAMGAYRAVVTIEPAPVVANTGPASSNTANGGSNGNNGGSAAISNTGPDSTNTIENPVGNTSINNTGPNSNNEANTGSIDTTGPDSNNVIDSNNNGNTNINNNLQVGVNNTVNSLAVTGNAAINSNTMGGNASTGDALAMANLLNMIQSAAGANGVEPNFYTANLQGSYNGDIVIDPGALANNINNTTSSDLKITNNVDASIKNDVDLLAKSGSATVKNNTKGGDATTGDATAVANIVNMINSSVSTGKSFIGVLNIDGDFEGDVLIADDVLDQLIAANIPTMQLCVTCTGNDLTINNNNDFSIDNQLSTNAQSGQANVSNNTKGGNATSGSADTNVTVFNLTGTQVVGENALLVFVNVMGEWVGFITNAPEHATAAALGSGTTTTRNSLPPYIAAPTGGDTVIDNNNNFSIENNINTSAITGDADVSSNTAGGNATTGDAYSAVNTANIANSSFGLTGWFGILFINVFGDWHGSFGTDTAYGDSPYIPPYVPSTTTGSVHGSNTSRANSSSAAATTEPQVRVFAITNTGSNGQISFTEQTTTQSPVKSAAKTSSAISKASEAVEDAADIVANANTNQSYVTYAVIAAGSLALLFGERILALLRRFTVSAS